MDRAHETAAAYRAFAAGNYAEADERAERVLREISTDPAALTLKGRIALVAGAPDVAQELFDRVLAQHPDVAALWLDRALASRDLVRQDDALEAVGRALALEPNNAEAWLKRGDLLLSLNDREPAAAAFRRVLELQPGHTAAYRGLCLASEPPPDSATVRAMLALSIASNIPARGQAELHYTLAQIYRRAGQPAEFIRQLFAANSKQRTLCRDGRAEYATIFDGLEAAFSRTAFASAAPGPPIEPTPIFILGMPRSGTTLVEQLLAAHPDVAAGGELNYMRGPLRRAIESATGQPFPLGFERIAGASRDAAAQAFASRLALIGRGRPYVTDKTPGNYHLIGLLCVLFPNAKVIHVARDPMDTCFSILQQPFDARSPHTCDMPLLAYVYARYVRLMGHWEELFGSRFHPVRYERLVASPAAEAQALFSYCGLEWRDSYLDFHRARTAVRTFSSAQVRVPIHQSSVGAWREFAPALMPLSQALQAELGDPRPG